MRAAVRDQALGIDRSLIDLHNEPLGIDQKCRRQAEVSPPVEHEMVNEIVNARHVVISQQHRQAQPIRLDERSDLRCIFVACRD